MFIKNVFFEKCYNLFIFYTNKFYYNIYFVYTILWFINQSILIIYYKHVGFTKRLWIASVSGMCRKTKLKPGLNDENVLLTHGQLLSQTFKHKPLSCDK